MELFGSVLQPILGYMRRAVDQYEMISAGDRVAVGVSGGKDSVLLLAALCRLRSFLGRDYDVVALTIDPCFDGAETDYSPVTALCEELGVRHVIRRSELGEIIFEQRQEHNPCALCARMRRGMLHDMARAEGCGVIALGHHRDDAVETFLMNLLHEGRIGCFQPKSWLSRKELTMIRPLCLAPEAEIRRAVSRSGIPVVKSRCPVDGATAREETKKLLTELEQGAYPGLSKRLFGAMQRAGLDGWGSNGAKGLEANSN